MMVKPAWSKNLEKAIKAAGDISPFDLAREEDFWLSIRQSYNLSPTIINLNNGGVSPAPKIVQEAMKSNYDFANEAPSFNMWRILDKGREALRLNLANAAGCSAEEIALNRNSSEGLETIIFGLPLKAGDEVVASYYDYPNIMNAWKQREIRDGIKVNWVNLDLPSEDENYLVGQYVKAFTPATRVINLTHVINWSGQILPVRKIADEAKKRNIQVVVDGAHSFALLNFKVPDLNCDYFATSLHKWLCAPIGTGMLYVKKNNIKGTYPLFATGDPMEDDIRKFERLGTRPFFIEEAISKALEFHNMIGNERKEKRLHYLKNYWMEKVKGIDKVKLNTSLDPAYGCAIGLVSIEGKHSSDLETFLYKNYNIHTTNIEWQNLKGVRITPNVYTSTKELDLLAEGIIKFAKA
ncbi:MAG TPA: aminotransferase class V-fold PLP-dependent enzyme [Flavisolibacter sp.]|nr:aminotransferase class V-fold PLP-dependent enzyme [Flavisolibacter sp.]